MSSQDNMLDPEILEHLMRDRKARVEVARRSHLIFFHLYFSRYVQYPTADFQRKLFQLTEDEAIKNAVIVAFRGSAKTTIMTLSYPLWAIVGVQQKKFVMLLSQTQSQVQLMLMNLKREIENNEILRNDFGPLEHQTDEWGRESLVIKKYGARIAAVSTETSIRGIRFGEHRPDLIIVDDAEDLNSVKTREGRNKTYDWLMGDVIPAGNPDKTRLIVIGNLLHEDSLLMRLKGNIDEKKFEGKFLWFPLLDSRGKSLWPGRFPNKRSIERLRKMVPSPKAWEREYMLHIIADQEHVVHKDWLHFYKELPNDDRNYRFTVIGVDLAISQKETADCTAMVAIKVYDYGDKMRAYVLPNSVNARLTFPQQVERVKLESKKHDSPYLCIEDVGYQRAIIQQLEQEGYNAEGIKTYGQDKRARLAIGTHLVQAGQVLFPEKGVEELLDQLTGFGVEKHDDLADAFAIAMLKIIEEHDSAPSITVFSWGGRSKYDEDGYNGPYFRRDMQW
jgi:predicted phage terminase large subunit-like protein